MITCSPPRFALPRSRGIDASSHLLFRAAGILGYLLAVLGALLRSSDARHGEAVIAVWAQIAIVSSSNATATRRFAGSSAATSQWPRRRF
jgi:hypothetical protein